MHPDDSVCTRVFIILIIIIIDQLCWSIYIIINLKKSANMPSSEHAHQHTQFEDPELINTVLTHRQGYIFIIRLEHATMMNIFELISDDRRAS